MRVTPCGGVLFTTVSAGEYSLLFAAMRVREPKQAEGRVLRTCRSRELREDSDFMSVTVRVVLASSGSLIPGIS